MGLPGRVRTRLATWGSTFSEGATQDGGAMAGVVNIFSASWVAGTTSARPLTVFSDPRALSKMRDYPPFKRLASHQNNRLASANVLAKCLWSVNKRKAAGRSECQQRFQMAVGRLECRLFVAQESGRLMKTVCCWFHTSLATIYHDDAAALALGRIDRLASGRQSHHRGQSQSSPTRCSGPGHGP